MELRLDAVIAWVDAGLGFSLMYMGGIFFIIRKIGH